MTAHRPQLLVSVRNRAEARDALAAGCDLLDVKEPANGPLGMADVDVLRRVADLAPDVPLSAALGECRDWAADDDLPTIPKGVTFVKLGTAGLGRDPNWTDAWIAVRRRFEQTARRPLNWVAVAYADWKRSDAPPPEAVLAAAVTARCAGVLFDTFGKSGRTLLDEIPRSQLREYLSRVRAAGLLSACAGGLSLGEISAVCPLRPDVVAVRSAACRGGDRNGSICRDAVRRIRSVLVAPPVERPRVSC